MFLTFHWKSGSLIWIQKYLPDLEIEGSPLELEFGAKPEKKFSLKEMKKEFEREFQELGID